MAEQPQAAARMPRLKLIAILAICAAPLITAWLLTSGTLDWRPQGKLHHGSLIEPPLPLQQISTSAGNGGRRLSDKEFRGRWTLMLFARETCGSVCETRMEMLRRVQFALGKNVVNVQRAVFLGQQSRTGGQVQRAFRAFPAFVKIYAPASLLNTIEAELAARGASGDELTAVLINLDAEIILSYGPELQFSEIHADLKRLLQAGNAH